MSDFEYLTKLYNVYNSYDEKSGINAMKTSIYNKEMKLSFNHIHQILNSLHEFNISSRHDVGNYKGTPKRGFLNNIRSKINTEFGYSDETYIKDPLNFLKEEFEKELNKNSENEIIDTKKIMKVLHDSLEPSEKYRNLGEQVVPRIRKLLNDHVKFKNLIKNDYSVDLLIDENLDNIDNYLEKLSCLDELCQLSQEYRLLLTDFVKIKQIEKKSIYNSKIENVQEYRLLCEDILINFNNSKLMNEDNYFDSYESFMNYFDVNGILHSIEGEFELIALKINKAGIYLNHAERYAAMNNDDSDISKFIKTKSEHNDPSIRYIIKTEQGKKFKNGIFFKDNSFIIEDKSGNLKTYQNNRDAKKDIIDFFKNYVDFKLRKNPTIKEIFLMKNDYLDLGKMKVMDSYLNNEDILKASKFSLKDTMQRYYSTEELDDLISATVEEHKLKKYAHSISSNKYKELYNDDTYKVIKELKALDISEKELQEHIGRKIAAYKTPEEFNNGLLKYLNSFNHFSEEVILEKAMSVDAECIFNENDVVILKINNFEASNVLGSASWCISRNEYYFNSYTNNDECQYFIYDFNKSSTDNDSMIGVTINYDGSYSTAHLKNDKHYEMDDKLEKIINKIVKIDFKNYSSILSKPNNKIESLQI